jgi:Na+/proline symporter
VVIGVGECGGLGAMLDQFRAVSPVYMNWFPDGMGPIGGALFVLGWFFGGAAVMGQPQIVVRFMSLGSTGCIVRMRIYYYLWFTFFYGATIWVGLLSRVLLVGGGFDPEQALPRIAIEFLHPWAAGLILAAIFAATMSTADSLVLSCSAAVTQDLYPNPSRSLLFSKLATATVVLVALFMALGDNQTVFRLVLMAWGLLASAFLPLLAGYGLGWRASQPLALAVMIGGTLIFLGWRAMGWGGVIYEVAPGIVGGWLIFAAARALGLGQTAEAGAGDDVSDCEDDEATAEPAEG